MNKINVVSAPLPFSNLQTNAKAMPGTSLDEIVSNVMPDRYKNAGISAIVMIDGEIIPMKYWVSIKPKANTLVNIRVVPTGGGGKKNPLTAILSIAILIAAPYAAGAILGSTLAATSIGIGTLTYGGVLASAIGVVGKLAISALAGPPSQSNAGANNVNNPAESPTQFIEGAKNSLNPYGTIPINLGTNRMFPLQASRPYTETQDNDQYVRQLFTYGYSDELVIDDLRIGETALSDFQDFDIEHKLAGDLHEGTNIYTNDVFQDDLNIVLNEVDGYSIRNTQPNVDEASIDVTFPQGLATFNSQGGRGTRRVVLEMQYALDGSDPEVWSPGGAEYTDFDGAVFSSQILPVTLQSGNRNTSGSRFDIISIDKYSGVISYISGAVRYNYDGFVGYSAPSLPTNNIKLADVIVTTEKVLNAQGRPTGVLETSFTVSDVRQQSDIGTIFENSLSFAPTKTNDTTITIAPGAILINDLDIIANQTESLRRTVRVVFPERGTYKIRMRRITDDSDSDQILDQSAWTAIKSVTYQSPVKLAGLSGSGIRIKATDQLNGALDQFNVLAQSVILDYDQNLDQWVKRITSNPASLYRYVYQSKANAKALPDDKLSISDLEDWHIHCENQGYTYNRVIDYDTTIDAIIRDICASGAASPAIVDGKRTIVIDRVKDDIKQMVTPRNSWGYTGEMLYPETPHAFRVQFRNAEKGFLQDELIVYDDGYDESNATDFEALELQSCTNAELAHKNARRHLATIKLRPETHTFMMDVENLTALRGNRIVLEHDVPIIGIGDGRIKEVRLTDDEFPLVEGFTIDDTVTIPNNSRYYVRIRMDDGTQIYKEIITSSGMVKSSFDFAVPFDVLDKPAIGDLCYFVEAGGELDLIINRIEPQNDLTARITALNYAPEIFDAENSIIPQFDSLITTPYEFIRPSPPTLLDHQSDESVMLLNSDGSFTPRAIFTLQNLNDGEVDINVKIRVSGTTAFTNTNTLEKSPERLILTGLDDGTRYDIHIRYRKTGTNAFSIPLELNNFLFIGASSKPDDVQGFKINVVDGVSYFKWERNDDIDLSHYKIKYSNVFTGGAWATAQVLDDEIYETKLTIPFLPGTYLIKAVDLTGNESETATAIITYDPGIVDNAIANLIEDPEFVGLRENMNVSNGSISLSDPNVPTGYYYFNNTLDLTGLFPAFVSAKVIANGAFINNIFDMDDIFAVDDIFGQGGNDIFAVDDIFNMDDVFGIGRDGWNVDLEYRTIETDPSLTDPINNLFPNPYDPNEWSDARGVIETDQTPAPNPQELAPYFREDTQNGQHYLRSSNEIIDHSVVKTYSIFIKSETRNIRMRARNDDESQNYIYAEYDLDALEVTVTRDNGTARFDDATIEKHANDWYRLTLTGIVDTVGSGPMQWWIYSLEGDELTYSGDDQSGFYFYAPEVINSSTAYNPTYSDWQTLTAGTIIFWGIQFRLKADSLQQFVTPTIRELSVTVDMPDRIERGDDIVVPSGGVTIDFSPEFKAPPAVAITIQDGGVDDKIEFINKTSGGFTFKVYNQTIGGYVERSFDYIASGFGRKNT